MSSPLESKIARNAILEFLRLEYKIRTFIEAEMNKPISGSINDAANDGTLIEFFNSVFHEDDPVTYNKDPQSTYAKIDNLSILNKILSDKFRLLNTFC